MLTFDWGTQVINEVIKSHQVSHSWTQRDAAQTEHVINVISYLELVEVSAACDFLLD